jgi:sRNA-binding protein
LILLVSPQVKQEALNSRNLVCPAQLKVPFEDKREFSGLSNLSGEGLSRSTRSAAAKALIEQLAERWPQCFSVYEKRRRPLQLGIHIEILAALGDAVTPTDLSVALGIYCANYAYLLACREGAPRIGLDGNPGGVVTAEESEHAAARLAGRARCTAKKDHERPSLPSAVPARTAP